MFLFFKKDGYLYEIDSMVRTMICRCVMVNRNFNQSRGWISQPAHGILYNVTLHKTSRHWQEDEDCFVRWSVL